MAVSLQEPEVALALALDIQEALYDHDWGTDALDRVYRTQTECVLAPRDYMPLWNGLRVRIGVHYGLPHIIYDEVTRGYVQGFFRIIKNQGGDPSPKTPSPPSPHQSDHRGRKRNLQ